MSVQDLKWIVIASVLLVSISLWIGAHLPPPNQSHTQMASVLVSAPSARTLTASNAHATGDDWHSPAELAHLKAEAARLDKEEQDLAKPVSYDASQGFDPQRLAASTPQTSEIPPAGPVTSVTTNNDVGYDFNSQVQNASVGDRSPSGGSASSGDQSAGDQSTGNQYFNPYDPANYYPPGYAPSGGGAPDSGSDNDNLGDDDSSGSSDGN